MNTVNAAYLTQYNRAFNSIRNRIMISAGDIGRPLKIRVIGNGTIVPREGGLVVKLFNTNVMRGDVLPQVVAKLSPDAFNAAAADEAIAIQYLRDTQNLGSIPFTVPVTNTNAQSVGQGALVECTVVEIKLRDGSLALGLNFNRVIPAENGTSVASAFDRLMAGEDVGASTEAQLDPFAATNVATDNAPAAAGRRAAATA